MRLGNPQRRQSIIKKTFSHAAWALFFLWVHISTSQAADLSALRFESEPGQPLVAQVPITNITANTDVSCFQLAQSAADMVHLEYTTLSADRGMLMLWSERAITTPVKLTLTDQCQHTTQQFTLYPDMKVSFEQQASVEKATLQDGQDATTLPTQVAEPVQTGIPLEAYDQLQGQINELQQAFNTLQSKSDALYATSLAQTNLLTSLKTQLVHLQNENHLLRTLVMTLGLALVASGFFFADWLRRHAAAPKRIKGRTPQAATEENTGPATQPHPGQRFASTLPPLTSSPDYSTQGPSTQPPLQMKAGSRLKAVPTHANDDVLGLEVVPQKLSSQKSTQSVMQDASRLFTHGRVNQAIEHLQQHLAKHPKCSPWMWLYLLDLLSKEGKRQEFDMMASECRKHFNLNVEHAPDPKQQGIESFPRVMKALQQAWGTPQVIALIDDLVYNTRLVPRMGFERSVFEDLMLLKEIACQTQNLPAMPPPAKTSAEDVSMSGNLRELQQLSEDLYILAPAEQAPFQYWTDFTFELDESSISRKSA
jgi:hypothetical protein